MSATTTFDDSRVHTSPVGLVFYDDDLILRAAGGFGKLWTVITKLKLDITWYILPTSQWA